MKSGSVRKGCSARPGGSLRATEEEEASCKKHRCFPACLSFCKQLWPFHRVSATQERAAVLFASCHEGWARGQLSAARFPEVRVCIYIF